jgi:hypothetical protein
MEGFSFVTPVTGLNRPNTGKEDDDDDDDESVLRYNTRTAVSMFTKEQLILIASFKRK